MREPLWLDAAEALAIHDRLLAIHGGAAGIRDEDLLASALARPRNRHAYAPGADLPDIAAAYTAGILGNHPFIDGNKRTGFVLGVLFLELNGLRFTADEEAAAQAVLSLAAGTLTETDYAAWLRDNVGR